YTKAVIVKVIVDANKNFAARFAIRSIPTLIVFKNLKQLETLMGVHTAYQL
ncbi:thioredoxin family protein, partial [Francisella tularensis subsp. holarctica]|uniref:thioredoxin family protein n=1 Tax=Francisella tularensis TaxID=263 RepID=UPI002381B054